MRRIASIATVMVGMSVAALSAQNDLSQLLPSNAQPVTLEVQDADLAAVLDTLATIGNFEIYLAVDVADTEPMSVSVSNANLEMVLRSVLTDARLTYRVVNGNTLLVSGIQVGSHREHRVPRLPLPPGRWRR